MMLRRRITFVLPVLVVLWLVNSVLSDEPQLIAQWPLDEDRGDVVHDVIGGNDGEFVGDKLEWVSAKFENGLKFGGAGAHVEIARDPEMESPESSTLSVWIKFDAVEGRQDIVNYADSFIILMQLGGFVGWIHDAGDNWIPATGSTQVETDKWYFVAVTYDSQNVKLYINGELEETASASGEIVFCEFPLWFGGAPANPNNPWWFIGIMDEVEIWDKAMTADEVMTAYQLESPTPSVVSSEAKLATTWGELKQ
jgi:hypothetical protein